MHPRITPNLWFDTEAERSHASYIGVSKNSRIVYVTHYTEVGPGPAGTVMTVEFELDPSAVRRHQWRPPVHVGRGRFIPDQLREPGRGRLLPST